VRDSGTADDHVVLGPSVDLGKPRGDKFRGLASSAAEPPSTADAAKQVRFRHYQTGF
jgi:hypothetical protein